MLTLFPEPSAAVRVRWRVWLMLLAIYREQWRHARAESQRRRYWLDPDKHRAAARVDARKRRTDRRAYMRWYNAQPGKRAKRTAYAAKWRDKNPDRVLAAQLRRNYGISLEDFNRMLIAQGGCCAICGRRKGGSRNQGVRLHVDHDHATGKPRGLLCGRCNRGIGQLGDDPRRVRAALRYLQRAQRLDSPAPAPLPLEHGSEAVH